MLKEKIISIHACIKNNTRAKVYIGSFCIIMVKQAMYKNYHTVRGVIILNLKVQGLQLLQLESHAVSTDDANKYFTALHQD